MPTEDTDDKAEADTTPLAAPRRSYRITSARKSFPSPKTPSVYEIPLRLLNTPRKKPKIKDSPCGSPTVTQSPRKSSNDIDFSTSIVVGPSPYKPTRMNHLISANNKRMKELRSMEEISKRLLSIKSEVDTTYHHHTPKTPVSSDTFQLFSEVSLVAADFVDTDSPFASLSVPEVVRSLKIGTLLVKSAKECRFLAYLTSVTTDRSFVQAVVSRLVPKMENGTFYFGWSDLKKILRNHRFSITKKACKNFNRVTVVNSWNFEFIYLLVQFSFERYSLSRLKCLLSFLVDSAFDPVMSEVQASTLSTARQVASFLVNELPISDLVEIIDRGFASSSHNTITMRNLMIHRTLVPLGRALGFKTVFRFLQHNPTDDCRSAGQLISILESNVQKLHELNKSQGFNLFSICEKLVISDSSDQTRFSLLGNLAYLFKIYATRFTIFDKASMNNESNRLAELASYYSTTSCFSP